MSKTSFLLVAVCALWALAGCDKDDSDESAPGEASEQAEDENPAEMDATAGADNPRCAQFTPDPTATGEGFGCFLQNFGFGACLALVGSWTEEEAQAQCNSLDEAEAGCLMANVFCDRDFVPAGLPGGAGGSAACIDWDVNDADGEPQEGKHQVTFGGTPEGICTGVAGGDQFEPKGDDGWPVEILPYERTTSDPDPVEPDPVEPDPVAPMDGDAGVPDASV